MPKAKLALIDEALRLPDAPNTTTEAKIRATGRQEEVDVLIAAYHKDKVAAKFSGEKHLREFVEDRLELKLSKDGFRNYMLARRNAKKPS